MKTKFLRCSTAVNSNAIVRKNIDGVEHIIVTSFTLPDDIVMNGIMYPADEIAKSYTGLNRTLAPVEHPTNSAGQFVSASDPDAIHKFHAGAYNDNAVKVGKRVRVDKVINVVEANKSDRGRRLLDRLSEIENSDNARPIHTSTGIFLEIEELNEPRTNAEGLEYGLIARNMIFDHDAILLDSIGAAQPHQGVGMAINSSGQKVDVEYINLDAKDSRVNQVGLSYRNLIEQLETEVKGTMSADWMYISDVFDDVFIVETEFGYFQAPYRIDDEKARVIGLPVRVERIVSYEPKVNAKKESDDMKDMILNALKTAGIDTEGLTDDQLFEAYNKHLQAANAAEDAPVDDKPIDGDVAATVANAVAAALEPLQAQIGTLQTKLNAADDEARSSVVKTIMNSKRYPELDEATLAGLPLETLQAMASNCGAGYGVPFHINDADDAVNAPSAMPE